MNQSTIAKGRLIFDVTGVISKTEDLSNIIFTPTNGALTPQQFSISMAETTQYYSYPMVIRSNQDGHPTLYLTDVDIDEIGYINQTYTDERVITAGKIAVLRP